MVKDDQTSWAKKLVEELGQVITIRQEETEALSIRLAQKVQIELITLIQDQVLLTQINPLLSQNQDMLQLMEPTDQTWYLKIKEMVLAQANTTHHQDLVVQNTLLEKRVQIVQEILTLELVLTIQTLRLQNQNLGKLTLAEKADRTLYQKTNEVLLGLVNMIHQEETEDQNTQLEQKAQIVLET